MRNIGLLVRNFTNPESHRKPFRRKPSYWWVRYLTRPFGLREAHARLYAGFMGLPVEDGRG